MQSHHPAAPSEHVVTFYASEAFIVEEIATYVANGLAAGERVLAIVMNAHWRDVATRLDERGVAYARALETGHLVIVDAEAVLEDLTHNAKVDIAAFRQTLDALLDTNQPTRMYGELVGLLTARGDVDTAAAIEELVHEASRRWRVPILCGYRTAAQTNSLSGADIVRLERRHDRSYAEPRQPPQSTDGHFHAVRFYKDSEELSRIVADFVAEGLALAQPAVIIATPEHRSRIGSHLRAGGCDVAEVQAQGLLTLLDADETLRQVIDDGMPHRSLFRACITPILERAAYTAQSRNIRLYGEMVDLLWKSGHDVAAIKLEMLWNELARTHRFWLLCGYSMGNFYKNADVDAICARHNHLTAASGEIVPVQENCVN